MMKSAIALGATPSFSETAFFALACGGDAELVKMMLRYVDQEGGRGEGERRGKSFFLIFCYFYYRYGACPNTIIDPIFGSTPSDTGPGATTSNTRPLNIACREGCLDVVKVLVSSSLLSLFPPSPLSSLVPRRISHPPSPFLS